MSVKGDKYASFAALAQHECEGKDYVRYIQARAIDIVIVAPHGGGIERGASEIAKALAGDVFSIYCFEGIKRTGNKSLHITSTRFDDPVCLDLIKTAATVITIHGCAGEEQVVYVGGLNAELQQRIIKSLRAGGFKAAGDNGRHPGMHPRNICNSQGGGGVQLEITRGLRQRMFKGLSRAGRGFTTPAFDEFVGGWREGIGGA
ncbi:MAG: poly-gamma-glutamate hydrolase family protein [Chloroflexota bacterium]|nr:poly-gamma-glutamate hydrolase family protein [Chloroflexota bacterium]